MHVVRRELGVVCAHVARVARLFVLAAGTGAVLAIAGAAWAQGVTGTVSGTVKDVEGGVIPGATVTLINEAQGTRLAPVVTNAQGDFVVPNIPADTYTIQVEMPSFKTLKRSGIAVSPGARLVLPPLTIVVGGVSEEVVVKGETPVVQTASGEKSYTISTEAVTSLPLANRSYTALLGLMPGVQTSDGLTPATRLGGGGDGNFMLDGATSMDPGVNRPATRVTVEAIQEVRVATSTYQAEYGRSSGLQVNAVTKSGTNQFHGAFYDVERKSKWNKNSQTNILNGDPKEFQDERDWGFAIGGPVGKPGRSNKLFFYFNQEFQPRTVGGDVTRYRVPTKMERDGDFSATTDNLGALYPYIKDPSKTGTCSASNTTACFNDSGVIGKIPKGSLYVPGMAILNWWPMPNCTDASCPGWTPGVAYNYQATYPALNLLGYQPVIRLDYQPRPNLRGSFKFLEYQQPSKVHPGIIAGWNDTREDDYGIWVPAATFNWTVSKTTFLEVSWGKNFHHQEGCSVSGAGPNFCRSALQTNSVANRITAGFGDIPYLFPDATKLDPNTFSYEVIARSGTSVWDGSRVQSAPSFTWGGRVANSPPNNIGPFGNFILDTDSGNTNITLTRVMGRHTAKAGYYYFKSLQRRGQGTFLGSITFTNDTNNPLDTSFPFANAAVGVFSQYQQQSRWGEGAYTAINHEAFIQDNWRMTRKFTLDYGLRFVHQVPQYDGYLQASNFLPETWKAGDAPVLYVAGCANGAATCTGNTNRQAMNPQNGQFLGVNTALAIGTLVPKTGNLTNGIAIPGKDIADTNGLYPTLAVAPRVGAAWDVGGDQKFVVRGGAGLFFDRPQAQNVYNTVNNPPFTRNVTVRYGQLQDLSKAGLTTEAPPALTVWQYDMPLPASVQWNGGVQMSLPFSTAVDISYTGQHSYDAPTGVNINNLDIGMAYNSKYADPTQATPTAANSYVSTQPDLVRFYKGYSTISQQQTIGWRTYHSIQTVVNRRFRNGLSFGFNDTWQLSDKQLVSPRLQHNSDGTITVRSDQPKAQELFGDNAPQAHVMRANFIWDLPDLHQTEGVGKWIAMVANDWALSGIWNGQSGTAYSVGFTYNGLSNANVNLTGSPDYSARVYLIGDQGSGCSEDPLRQFNAAAFKGPAVASDGLESSNSYLTGCFQSWTDLAISRTIRLGASRTLQLRADVFNVFNQAAITGRVTNMQLASLNEPTTIQNLPYNPDGSIVESRSKPRGGGFGVANAYQAPRTVQIQIRFGF